MAKRSPESGSSPEKGKSVFKEKSAKRIAALEAEISASVIDQDKKEHLLKVAKEITSKLDLFSEAKDKQVFKNNIDLEIAGLGLEFQSVKNSARNKEAAKDFNLEAYKSKEKKAEQVKDLLAQLEKAREHLAKESAGVKEGVLFKNFGRYKRVKTEISALLNINDDAEYEAKKDALMLEILALHDIKKEEKPPVVEEKPKASEVAKKEKEDRREKRDDEPEPEIFKNKQDGEQGERRKKHDLAIKRWHILQGVVANMAGKDAINRETFEFIESDLDVAKKTNSSEEYEDAMLAFEQNFNSIIFQIPDKMRLEYYSQLNGNPPSWEKEVEKNKDKDNKTADANKEWVKEKDSELEYAKKRWETLSSVIEAKMGEEDRKEFAESVENIKAALEKIEKADDFDSYAEARKMFEANFAEVLIKGVSREVRKEYNRQKSSFGKADKENKEPVAPDASAVVKNEEQDKREQRHKEASDKFVLLKRIAEDVFSDEEIDATRDLVEEIENSLNLAKDARNVREYNREIDRAESAFAEFLTKIPPEVKAEFDSQFAGNAPALKREDRIKKDVAPIKPDKKEDKEEIKDKIAMVEEVKKRFALVREIVNRTKSPMIQEGARPKAGEFKDVLLLMEKAQNQAEFDKNKKQFEEMFEKLCTNVGVDSKNVTEAFLQEKINTYGEKVKDGELKFGLILTILKENGEDLVSKLSQQIGYVRGKLRLAKKDTSSYSVSQLDRSIDNLLTAAGEKSGKNIPEIFNDRMGYKIKVVDDPSVARVDMKVVDTNVAVAELEKEPSPEQKMYLASYERDFGTLEKLIADKAAPDVKDSIKWRVDVVRTTIEKAKKEMSQHNKMDETVLYNIQSLLENLQKLDPKLHAEFIEKITPKAATPPAAPTPEKKGFWARAKETVGALFTKETGKKLVESGYKTVARVSGLKLASDFVYGLVTGKGDLSKGKGDLSEYIRGKRESRVAQVQIAAAYENLVSSVERSENNEVLGENDRIEKRMAYLQSSVEAAKISPEAKQQILQRLEFIYRKHRQDTDKAKTARTEEVRKLLDSHIRAKVEGLEVAKDALNFALSATGFTLLRGAMYLSGSILERLQKGKKEYAKQTAGLVGAKSEAAFVAKDAIINTAIETARVLAMQGVKPGETKLQRAADVVKLASRVLTALGIAGVAFSDTDPIEKTMSKFVDAAQKEGVVDAVKDNFVQGVANIGTSIEKGAHAVANPIDTVEQVVGRVTGQTNIKQEVATTTHNVDLSKEEIAPKIQVTSAAEAVPEAVVFSVQNFAAEHGLSKESLTPLQKLVEQYPSLKEESLVRILDASKVGDGIKFHHGDLVRGDVDTLIEAEGERRSVIFEELVKAKDYEAAAKYLESQNFSSRHKSYIEDYIGKGTHEDYLNFAKQYDEKPDKKMVYGLFRAMQGKGNTDLANAGLVRAATESRAGRTISLQGGELKYFGLDEKGEPILSGQGRAVVKETVLVKITTSPTVIETVEDESAVKAEVDADRVRFEKMREDAMNISDRVSKGEPVGTYIIESANKEAPALPASNTRPSTEIIGEETTSEKTIVGKTVKTYTASGEVVQAEKGYVKPGARTGASSGSEVKAVPETKPAEEASETKKSEILETDIQITEEQKENLKLMVKNYEAMDRYFVQQRLKFTFVGDGQDILNEQIRNEPTMLNFKDYVKKVINGEAENLDKKTIKGVEAIKQTLDSFVDKDKIPNWYSGFNGAELKLFLDSNRDSLPMLANDSHIARIMDQKGEEFILSDQDNTFVVKDDKLLKMNDGKVVKEYTYEEAVKLVKDMDEKESAKLGKEMEEESLRQANK